VAAPSVSSVDPNAGPVDGGTPVTITGAGFTGATEVDFGGIAAGFVVESDTSITALSPAASAGTVDVTVTTLGGTSAPSAADQFTYG
jgi:IPT/TIG domain-containing protein